LLLHTFGKELPISVPTGNRNPVFQPVVSQYEYFFKTMVKINGSADLNETPKLINSFIHKLRCAVNN
jgi:hypothetical protein